EVCGDRSENPRNAGQIPPALCQNQPEPAVRRSAMIPENKPVCWVVGAGDFDAADFSPRPGDLVIAADGGYVHLTTLGVVPDILLGDFDSLDTVPDFPNIVRHPVRKDDGDTAL